MKKLLTSALIISGFCTAAFASDSGMPPMNILEPVAATATAAATGAWYDNFYVAGRVGAVLLDNHTQQTVVDTLGGTGATSTIADKHLGEFGARYHAALGYDFNPVRVELEYAYAHAMSADGKWTYKSVEDFPATFDIQNQIHTFMANAYYDIDLDAALTPFVNIGVGYANIRERGVVHVDPATDMVAHGNLDELVLSAGAGFSWRFTDDLRGEAGYRFSNMGTSDATANGSSAHHSYNLHEVMVGLRYYF